MAKIRRNLIIQGSHSIKSAVNLAIRRNIAAHIPTLQQILKKIYPLKNPTDILLSLPCGRFVL
jgi:hypothetical protein